MIKNWFSLLLLLLLSGEGIGCIKTRDSERRPCIIAVFMYRVRRRATI